MDTRSLPLIDEHTHVTDMPPERAWASLVEMLGRVTGGTSAKRYARLIGCDPVASDGAFPAEGGTIPGFRVAHGEPPRAITLCGRHRFADYTFEFQLEPVACGGSTRVRAVTRAEFPGVAGRVYRLAVIGSGGHAMAVRRMLRALG